MIRKEVEKLRGYEFTEDEVREIISPGMPFDTEGKIAYLKCTIIECKNKLDNILFTFSHRLPLYFRISKKANPYGRSSLDALKFVREVLTELFTMVEPANRAQVSNPTFNLDNYKVDLYSENNSVYVVKVIQI